MYKRVKIGFFLTGRSLNKEKNDDTNIQGREINIKKGKPKQKNISLDFTMRMSEPYYRQQGMKVNRFVYRDEILEPCLLPFIKKYL